MDLADQRRLAAVESSGLLSPERQALLDHLAELVQLTMDVPVALVSTVLDDEQVFSGAAGLDEPWASTRRTPLSHSFCQHVVTDESPLVVSDAREHALLHDNEAIEDLGVTAYCGVPIIDEDGQVLGSLCAIDDQARDWSEADVTRLQHLVPILRDQITSFRRRSTHRTITQHAAGEAQRVVTMLERSNRNLDAARATVDEFLALAAHDLRSPMATALTVVDTLQQGDERIPSGPLLDALHRSISRSLRLLDRLHDHARAGTVELDPAPVDLNVVVRGVLDDASAAITARNLTVQQEALLPMVHGDDVLLGQLLSNVLGNALRYAADGEREATVWITGSETDDGVHVTVSDDGPGIPADVAPNVFNAGVRGARGSAGIGMGLATCRTITERHGGRIWVDRAEQGGARVNIVLPGVPRERRQVLIVEGDPDVQLLYGVVLEQRTRGELRIRMAGTIDEATHLLDEAPLVAGDLAVIDVEPWDRAAIDLIDRLVAGDVQVLVVGRPGTSGTAMRAVIATGATVTERQHILDRGIEDLAERIAGQPG